MAEEIERVIGDIIDRIFPLGDTDALGTFAEFHGQPVLTFRNGSYISANRCAYSADVIRSAIARAENWPNVRSFDDWVDVKDACEVFVGEANLNTQKLDEFLAEM